MLDSVVVANEAMDEINKRKHIVVLVKGDFEKA